MNRRPDPSSESGVSLVMVLVTLVVFGLLVPVLGQFGSTNGVSGYVVKGQRYDRYAADNGVQAAIAYAASRLTAGRAHVPCPKLTSTMNPTSPAFKRVVTVKCQGFDGTGIPQDRADIPTYAVLALANSGAGIDLIGGGRLQTRGAWFANSTSGNAADIESVVDASVDLFGANGRCKLSRGGQLFAAPNRCNSSSTVADPGYRSAVNVIGDVPVRSLDYDPVNGDPCEAVPGNRVLILAPGHYWDSVGLNKIAQGLCGPVILWLQPGRFYFDFDFYNPESDPRWTIGRSASDTKVAMIGGAANGWTPTLGVDAIYSKISTANSAGAGGACDTARPGVELVFGSAAHLEVQSPDRVELCPLTVSADSQRLSIVGRTSGTTSPSVAAPVATPTSAVPAGEGTSFSWPAALTPGSLDGVECTNNAPCDPTKFMAGQLTGPRRRATVTMTVPNRVPTRNRLDQLVLTVVHREPDAGKNGRDGDTVSASLASPMPGVRCAGDLRLSDRWHADPITCTLDPSRPPMPASATFTVTLALQNGNGNGNGNNQGDGDNQFLTFQVDQVRVDAKSTAPSLRAQSGCVVDGSCSLLFADNSGGAHAAALFVWGTVSTPLSDLSLDAGGQTRFKLARGVVVRSLTMRNLPDVAGFVPVELPGGGLYSDREVVFEAFLGTSTTPSLRARVRFCDAPGPSPCSPGDPPMITAWDLHP